MGDPVELKRQPLFIADDIDDLILHNTRVIVGKEGAGCSFYTNNFIIKRDGLSQSDLDALKKELYEKYPVPE
jgi:hypothetical protein